MFAYIGSKGICILDAIVKYHPFSLVKINEFPIIKFRLLPLLN